MSRLAKTVVTEREDFVRNLFRTNLRLTGAEVQTQLKEKFTKMMRPNRIYELKREITLEALGTTPATVTTETAAVTPTDVTPTTTVTPEVAVVPVTVTTVDSVPSVG